MIFCKECFYDKEIQAAIETIGHSGDCPVCGKKRTWIYDSDIDEDDASIEDMISSILEIYVPESNLPVSYPDEDRLPIAERLCNEWRIFSGSIDNVMEIVKGVVNNSLLISDKILFETVGIPELYDEDFLLSYSILGNHSWEDFKKHLRNTNRFHSRYINLEILKEILEETVTIISVGDKFYRARVSNEKGHKGFSRKEMWAPPDDVASPGRANSKGQSCLYLSNKKEITVKEIRAHAFDYVTIATFRLNREIKVLDLSSLTHSSPFYKDTNKIAYMVNEKLLSEIERDLAKPMSRWDSDLDYLPTQYISDFAKYLGYDGVMYYSTFDKGSFNLAVFDSKACDCIYHRNFHVGDLDYKITAVD